MSTTQTVCPGCKVDVDFLNPARAHAEAAGQGFVLWHEECWREHERSLCPFCAGKLPYGHRWGCHLREPWYKRHVVLATLLRVFWVVLAIWFVVSVLRYFWKHPLF